jgi:hypothetical protein
MRVHLVLRALAFACAAFAIAAPAAPPRPAGALTLEFVAVDGAARTLPDGRAWLDVGRLHASRHASAFVRQRVGLRLEGPYATARVSVSLAGDMPGGSVRVNGRAVSSLPHLIDPAHRLGTTVVHEIELAIPSDVPPGAFLNNLQWMAETP